MKKIVSLILALAMCFSLTPAVFAADATTADTEEAPLTLEQAAEILGLPIEELEGLEIRKLSSDQNIDGISVLNLETYMTPGVYYEELSLPATFTGAIHTIAGKKFTWGAALSPEAQKNPLMNLHIVLQYTTGAVISYCDLKHSNPKLSANYWYTTAQSKQVYFKYTTVNGSSGYVPNSKFLIVFAVSDSQ